MDRQDMLALAARVEQATGPDRELDALIGKSVAAQPFAICDTGNVPIFASYTASLDAAMTLVPEGWFWRAGHGVLWPGWAHLNRKHPDDCVQGDEHGAHAETSALALCAAALKARANLNDKDGGERG